MAEKRVTHELVVKRINRSGWFDKTSMSIDDGDSTFRGRFGTRLGPVHSEYLFYHDLGHAIDFVWEGRIDRLSQFGYGLGYTTSVECLGEIYYEPTTAQGVHRECRADAIMMILRLADNKRFKLEQEVQTASEAYRFLGDYHNVPLADKFDYDRDPDYNKKEQAREQYCKDKIYQYIDKFRLSDVVAGWNDACNYWKNLHTC